MELSSLETFEQSLSRLEEIIDTIENRETGLESAMALYKEGLLLSQHCGELLSRYETEVSVLKKESDGLFSQTAFSES
jgi:exodeoxyribonuclease VII small subunit